MSAEHRTQANRGNTVLISFILPAIFLTVSLLGGVRVVSGAKALIYSPPSLVTLILAVLLLLLFVRAHLIRLDLWVGAQYSVLTNISHILALIALFFASAQILNSILPERGLFRWMFEFFFFWTLWTGLFSRLNPARLTSSLGAQFLVAFLFTHVLLANLYPENGSWLQRLAGTLVQGATTLSLEQEPRRSAATGYISFFTVALYVVGLLVFPQAPEPSAGPGRALTLRETSLSEPEKSS